jgi:predicted protein tyrosine phosphatase
VRGREHLPSADVPYFDIIEQDNSNGVLCVHFAEEFAQLVVHCFAGVLTEPRLASHQLIAMNGH